jgi:two-component system, response regulator YesN
MQIGLNPRVNNLLNLKEPLSDSAYYDFQTSINTLSTYMINRTFIDTFYIYMKNTNYVITPDTLYPADVFYDRVLKYNKEQFANWQEMLINNYYVGKYVKDTSFYSEESNTSNISYIQSLPISYVQKSQGALIVSFDSRKLIQHFSPAVLDNGGWAYIQDEKGNIITSLSKSGTPLDGLNIGDLKSGEDFIQKHIDDNDMIITYTTSNINGWKYVTVLPSDVVLVKLDTFKRNSWIIFGLSTLVGIFIACLLAYHNSKPVLNIIRQLKDFIGDDTTDRDAYSVINGSVSKLITNNRALNEDINSQKPLIQAAFLDKLMRGQIYNETELLSLSSYLGIDIQKKKFLVLLLRIYYNDTNEINFNGEFIHELHVSKAVVRGLLSQSLDSETFIHDIDYRTIAVFWSFDSSDNDSILNYIQNNMKAIKNELLDNYNMKVFIGGGDLCDSPLEVWQSFEKAEQALSYALASKDTISWYSTIPRESEAYYYPLDLEQRLINHTKLGDIVQVQKLLSIIKEENFSSRNLSLLMSRELISELKSTVVKLMSQFTDEATIKKRIKSIDLNNSIQQNFEVLEDVYTKVCEFVQSQKSSQNMELMDNIKKYIETNYTDQNLSLYKVSSQFSLSEGYFSHLFKEQTTINFTDYLENVRMYHARELLKDKTLSINDISEMIGYNSAQSFRRAFKRVCGVSPTALRDN